MRISHIITIFSIFSSSIIYADIYFYGGDQGCKIIKSYKKIIDCRRYKKYYLHIGDKVKTSVKKEELYSDSSANVIQKGKYYHIMPNKQISLLERSPIYIAIVDFIESYQNSSKTTASTATRGVQISSISDEDIRQLLPVDTIVYETERVSYWSDTANAYQSAGPFKVDTKTATFDDITIKVNVLGMTDIKKMQKKIDALYKLLSQQYPELEKMLCYALIYDKNNLKFQERDALLKVKNRNSELFLHLFQNY